MIDVPVGDHRLLVIGEVNATETKAPGDGGKLFLGNNDDTVITTTLNVVGVF